MDNLLLIGIVMMTIITFELLVVIVLLVALLTKKQSIYFDPMEGLKPIHSTSPLRSLMKTIGIDKKDKKAENRIIKDPILDLEREETDEEFLKDHPGYTKAP